MLKKRIILLTITLFVSLFVLSGCTSKSSDKELINETKKDIETVSTQIFDSANYKTISSDYYQSMLLMFGHDVLVELEDSTKIYIQYDNNEINGMVTGEDKTDNKKYHIYIGSKTYDNLWSYATIDLDSGDISWQDNY